MLEACLPFAEAQPTADVKGFSAHCVLAARDGCSTRHEDAENLSAHCVLAASVRVDA